MLRLNSVICEGFVNGVGLIEYLFSYLLFKHKLDYYERIIVNHIGAELEEKIFYDKGRRVHINIRYALVENFVKLDVKDKILAYLEIIQIALLRLSKEGNKIDGAQLEVIKSEILDHDFKLDIDYMLVENIVDKNLAARISLRPSWNKFQFVIQIFYRKELQWEALIYEGGPSSYYFDDILLKGTWKGRDKFIIVGKRSEIEFHVSAFERKIDLINNAADKSKAPIFNMFRVDAGSKEMKDYIDSLPPAVAAIINFRPN